MSVMAEQHLVSDYISIILKAIDATQQDPAQLRGLVYDVTRINLGKLVLSSYKELGRDGLQKYLVDLELAIREAERICRERDKALPPPANDQQLLGSSAAPSEGSIVADLANAFGGSKDLQTSTVTQLSVRAGSSLTREVYATPELLPPIEILEPTFGRSRARRRARWLKSDITVAVLIGVAIYAVTLARSNYLPVREFIHALQPSSSSAGVADAAVPSNVQPTEPLHKAKDPGFPLPTGYGVYALDDGKLFPLDVLPLKVPDPRVAISALFSGPSRDALPDGKLAFVIFRRDLVSSAPMQVFVRVVAQVARQLAFSEKALPTVTDVDGQWAVRGKSYEFGVGPVDDNPEMVILRPKDPDLKLVPGRYALVLAGQGYDFTVSGKITDPAQCLERTEVVGGAVYSECRTRP
jgi:hypothetical protein